MGDFNMMIAGVRGRVSKQASMFRGPVRKLDDGFLLAGTFEHTVRRDADAPDDIHAGWDMDVAVRPEGEPESERAIGRTIPDGPISGDVDTMACRLSQVQVLGVEPAHPYRAHDSIDLF